MGIYMGTPRGGGGRCHLPRPIPKPSPLSTIPFIVPQQTNTVSVSYIPLTRAKIKGYKKIASRAPLCAQAHVNTYSSQPVTWYVSRCSFASLTALTACIFSLRF